MDIQEIEDALTALRDPLPDNPRYDLIPWECIRRTALVYSEGATRYGDYNWQKGLPASVIINHMFEHLNNFDELVVCPAHFSMRYFALHECQYLPSFFINT